MKKKIFALLNPHSGPGNTLQDTILAVHELWEDKDHQVSFQLSKNKEDAQNKIAEAKEWGADLIICSGGDGTLNSLLPALIKHEIPVAFIPTGSVNGFARHYNIPQEIPDAVKALKAGENRLIDVGTANDMLFILSCSFAWEASLVKLFEDLPTRGIATYLAAAGITAFSYAPQAHEILNADGTKNRYEEPMLLSVTNLSNYTEVDLVSEDAKADDGLLELVVVEKENMLKLTTSIGKLKEGGVEELDMVETFRDRSFEITRQKPADIQIDGEVIPDQKKVKIGVMKKALHVRVPKRQ
ncbi:diacylglycerol kinase family protein [Kiritimatiellaeota bacterium B1221]|nr:diacylglycerol kinase family protein [Kiritimatiellaeota bacterium B1221]